MEIPRIPESEYRLCLILWEQEPIRSPELIHLCVERLGWKETTAYTILKRLENADMLTVRTAEHGGRLRKYYRITQPGLKRIAEFQEDWKEILAIYRFVTKEGKNNEAT